MKGITTRAQGGAKVYKTQELNRDVCPIKGTLAGSVLTGNARFVVQIENGFRKILRYSNAKPGMQLLTFEVKFPAFAWEDTKKDVDMNRCAVAQGIISKSEFSYFYPRKSLVA